MVWLKRDAFQPLHPHGLPAAEHMDRATANPPAESLPDSSHPAKYAPAESSREPLGLLRKLLEDGLFPPGSKLPPERALAEQLGVGRPALREAIKALGAMNVLESRHGSGTYVKAREAAATRMHLPADLEVGDFGILEVLEARKILEPRAAWLAATRADEEHLRDIEAARQKLELHLQDWRLVARLDYELHAAIIRGARNPVLEQLGKILTAHLYENRSLTARFAPDVERLRREHNAIVEAILKRQADCAEKAMIEHLNSAGLDFISEASP